ncbi:hypothetical protein [uncultured Psychrobacter sp.]|uniref:hypothetical protein n=1 Tax=uncultured Psychrobacter sp. TaxID=259303 RepID=UPI003458AD9C
MSNDSNHTSDVEKAANQVNVQEIEDNLQNAQDNQQEEQPETLTEDQRAPFIDENARTDK